MKVILTVLAVFGVSFPLRELGAASPTPYEIVDLGEVVGGNSEARAINYQGKVLCLSNPVKASGWFVYENGIGGELFNPAGTLTASLVGLNDSGYVVGNASLPSPRTAAAFMGALGGRATLAHPDTQAHGINNLGAMASAWFTRASFRPDLPTFPIRRAARLFGSSLKDLGTLSSDNPFADSDALAINSRGTLVGWSTLAGKIGKRAVRWKGGGPIEDLHPDPIEDRTNSVAIDVNQGDWVAGYAFNLATAMDAVPVIWDASKKPTLLPLLRGDRSAQPFAINAQGEVVGFGSSSGLAILWKTNRAHILQDLVPRGTDWRLEVAYDINDSGQIVGYGKRLGEKRAFLLTRKPAQPLAQVRWEWIDPYPSLITYSGVTSDVEALRSAGGLRVGLAADGGARLLLRLESSQPGRFVVSLDPTEGGLGTMGSENQDGELSLPGSRGSSLTVSARTILHSARGYHAFLVYHAPVAFDRSTGEDSLEAFRSLVLSLRFTPDEGDEVQLGVPVTIARSPVVVFHGLWSKADDAFGGFKSNMLSRIPDLQITGPDYPNAQHLAENRFVVRDAIDSARERFRAKGYAVARVDVYAHSMGGVLTRAWTQDSSFTRAENFYAGDIHRFVPIDSPLHGAYLADALSLLKTLDSDRYDALATVMRAFGNPIDAGALDDLGVFSEAIYDLNLRSGATACHAVIGDYEPDVGVYTGLIQSIGEIFDPTGFGKLMRRFLPESIPLDTDSDLLVTVSSQSANLESRQTSIHGHWHMGAANQVDVVDRCFGLLNTWSESPKWAKDFPAWTPPLVRPAPLKLASFSSGKSVDHILRILEPLPNASAVAGNDLRVRIELDPPFEAKSVVVSTRGHLNESTNGSLTLTIPIRPESIGPQTIGVLAKNAAGDWASAEVKIQVRASSLLRNLAVEHSVEFLGNVGMSVQLRVEGTYMDGITRDLTSSLTGTRYLSSDPTVAEVGVDGKVTGLGFGYATVTVSNATQVAVVDLYVSSPKFSQLLPEIHMTLSKAGVELHILGFSRDLQLQTAPSLGAGERWEVVKTSTNTQSEELHLEWPIHDSRRFFRLR